MSSRSSHRHRSSSKVDATSGGSAARSHRRQKQAWDASSELSLDKQSEFALDKLVFKAVAKRSGNGQHSALSSSRSAGLRFASPDSSCSGSGGRRSPSPQSPTCCAGCNDTFSSEATTALPLVSRTCTSETVASLEDEAEPVRDSAEAEPGLIGPNWICGHVLGRGSYGSVSRGFDPSSGRIFAVKKTMVDADEKANSALEEELRICQDLRHPHIVGYLGHQRVDNTLNIYLEYCAGGSIASILSEFGPLEVEMLRRATSGMLEGLAYLHEHNPCIVHRDIKGANLLVDLKFNVKLADFGCSKRALVSQSFTTIGSVPWMAPEVIQQQTGYGRKADIWSAGCTVLEMVTAEKPWGNGAFDNMMAAMMRIGLSKDLPPIPDGTPATLNDFISNCISRDPGSRPQATDLLKHDFLRGL